jgi:hypothetical protein
MATSRAPTEHYSVAMTTVGVAAGIFALCRCKISSSRSLRLLISELREFLGPPAKVA